MGFDEAVNYVNAMALPNGLLWLSLPINAIASVRRQKKLHPGSVPWLACGVLILWLGQIAACVYAFSSGVWYGENGPAPQVAAAEIMLLSAFLVAIHTLLLTSARPSLELPLGPGWLTRHRALGILMLASLACAALYVWELARPEQLRREELAAHFNPKIVYVPQLPVQVQIAPAQPLRTLQLSPSAKPTRPDAQAPPK